MSKGKRIRIKAYITINSGEIRFGRLVEEKLWGKKKETDGVHK